MILVRGGTTQLWAEQHLDSSSQRALRATW